MVSPPWRSLPDQRQREHQTPAVYLVCRQPWRAVALHQRASHYHGRRQQRLFSLPFCEMPQAAACRRACTCARRAVDGCGSSQASDSVWCFGLTQLTFYPMIELLGRNCRTFLECAAPCWLRVCAAVRRQRDAQCD